MANKWRKEEKKTRFLPCAVPPPQKKIMLGDLWFVDYEKDMVTFALSGVFPFV